MTSFLIIMGSILVGMFLLAIGLAIHYACDRKSVLIIVIVICITVVGTGIFCGATSKTTYYTISATVTQIDVCTYSSGAEDITVHVIDDKTNEPQQYFVKSFSPDITPGDKIDISFAYTKTCFGEINEIISITRTINHIAESFIER